MTTGFGLDGVFSVVRDLFGRTGAKLFRAIALAACVLISGAALPGGAALALNKAVLDDPDGYLSATEYYTLMPFVIPIIDGGVHKRQLTLILAIRMFDDGDREELKRVAPRFRDAIYQSLFKLVSFRTAKPRIPTKAYLQAKLYPIIKKLGGDMVKSLKVHKLEMADRP
jgi:hypothetical protein